MSDHDYQEMNLKSLEWIQRNYKDFLEREPSHRTHEQDLLDFIMVHIAHLNTRQEAHLLMIKRLQETLSLLIQNGTYQEKNSGRDQNTTSNRHPI